VKGPSLGGPLFPCLFPSPLDLSRAHGPW
jgi:hypothetical protein